MEYKRQIAIGDVHGCFEALKALLDALNPDSGDQLVFLGDIVDRGPDTSSCIENLIQIRKELNCKFIMGNHEEMMLDARLNPANLGTWMNFGGDSTLSSYSESGAGIRLNSIPEEHWDFIESFVPYYESDKYIFVHGMINGQLTLDRQVEKDLRWAKFENPCSHLSGKQIVCGHTSQKTGRPLDLGHSICIDTYIYGDGWLTAFETKSEIFIQTNQSGEVRGFERAAEDGHL